MKRSYAQACALARALDVLGERWTLLIVRELLAGPKRFTDLEGGLPGVPSSLLGERLRELQDSGLVTRRRLPPPAASQVYELSDRGRELEPAMLALGRWGARYGRAIAPTDASMPEWYQFALRTLFRPEAARGVHATYRLHFGDGTIVAEVHDGVLGLHSGKDGGADVVVSTDHATFVAVATGKVSVSDAVNQRMLSAEGDRRRLDEVFEVFSAAAG
jgi:DNA-binding HxlR family transcriptional regulator